MTRASEKGQPPKPSKTELTQNTMLQGTKTAIYTDVKIPVYAGMQFGTTNYKIRKVGYEVIRQYFDTIEKDWQVGSERIKRVTNAK
jgi:hypothetical protein